MKSKKSNSTVNLSAASKLKKPSIWKRLLKKNGPVPQVYNARDFGLYREDFSPAVLSVIKTLQKHKHQAYVVGGGVRDQLLQLHPKDFDVATDASPEEVRKCFDRALIIGKRFRLVHVYFNRRDFIEVATFRAGHENAKHAADASTRKGGIIARDNVYGSIDEDAFRRDFTINAFYYDPHSEEILDFCGGIADMQARVLRMIGKPQLRFQEDPVRILRALRISNKMGFTIEPKMFSMIPKHVALLAHISPGRLFDEYTKLLLHGQAYKNFYTLKETNVLVYLFPQTLAHLDTSWCAKMIDHALENTDQRYYQGKTIHPGFLIAIFLYAPLLERFKSLSKSKSKKQAFVDAMDEVLKMQAKNTTMPNYFAQMVRDVWSLQRPMELKRKNKVLEILRHTRFRAAYDFMLLRAEVGQASVAHVQFWTEVQRLEPEQLQTQFGDETIENI